MSQQILSGLVTVFTNYEGRAIGLSYILEKMSENLLKKCARASVNVLPATVV